MKRLIILRWQPGSGETTVGKLIEKQGHGRFIDHNSILTFIAGIAGNDDGIYDEIHSLEKAITQKLLNEVNSVIIARGFSNHKSIQPYIDIASNNNAKAIIIRLDTPIEILE